MNRAIYETKKSKENKQSGYKAENTSAENLSAEKNQKDL